MNDGGLPDIERQLEETLMLLKATNDGEVRRKLLFLMRQVLIEADRIAEEAGSSPA